MRRVHIISVTEPLLLDLALAIREKGFEVSASGEGLTESIISKLEQIGCICYGNGWFPEKLSKDIFTVVLGATVKKENPELLRAEELGLLTQSAPEFIFQRTKSKTRVVVTGSHGKKSILSMMIYALQKQKLNFDYALTSEYDLLPSRFSLLYEPRIALIEGDEHITSALDKRFKLEFYRPQLAVIAGMNWSEADDHHSEEEYIQMYRSFIASIEREGKLIYYNGDETSSRLAQEVREDITSIPFEQHEVAVVDGKTYLSTRYGDYEVYVTDPYFLVNINAARLACRQLGVKDADFYKAISEYSLSLQA
ncbi:Mur ligase family protein [Parabacteroides sp. PF5-9]|uniref:Mur ligase family protein n=1 Tax=Parabacteroides sp. PF5-9 TaxID=1742404 RepID=UPI002473FBC8|nr:Mur ligase family protein [Parabacteroides sp. PF5-9]MDH6356668.1 UDP-N-acetylmuramate: L-alanyl-gamma-D-glutamyl-meso-diaminopimelate ligase [Parabacteroides sp. PF5-9]